MTILLRKAWRDLRVRPARSLLTLVGILIGVAGVVAVVLAGRTFTAAQRRAYQNQSQADITVWVWNADERVVRALAALPGMGAVERRAVAFTKWRSDLQWLDIELEGVEDFENVRVNQMELLEGRFPGRGEIALESSARDLAAVEIGQTIEIRGATGDIQSLTVSGFTRTPYYPSAGLMRVTVGYVPAATARPFLETRGDNRILMRLEDFSWAEELRPQIESLLDRRHVPRGALDVRDPNAYTGQRELETLLRLMAVLSGLAVVISTFLVTNTLAAIVAAEVREIGILKALGTSRLQILRVYLWTGLVYALVGTPLGLAAGYWGGWQLLLYLGHLLNVNVGAFSPDPLATAAGLAVGLGVTVPASLFPAWRGTHVTVRQALQGYGIRAELGEGLLRRLRLPPLWAFPLRNLARRPGRSATTLLVTAVAVAAFLAARITAASLDLSIHTLFGVYASDAWVWFDEPVGAGFTGELRSVAGVESAEGWVISSCILDGEQVRLWGLPAETTLYRRDVVAGRWYAPGTGDEAVLSLDLAERQGWQVGDLADVEIGGRVRRFGIVGIVRDEAIFGLGDAPIGKVFLPVSIVQQMQGQSGWVDFFALGLDRHDRAGIDAIMADVESKYRVLRPVTEPMYVGYDQARAGTRVVSGLLGAMVAIVGTIGLVGILNTQTLNVLERRREIGVLRALGALRGHLVRFFVAEGLALGTLGFLLGAVVGWGIARLLVGIISAALITLHFTVPPADVLLSLGFALALSTVAGTIPALAAARLRTVEVLRYE
jgi:putative ABC transport system permease protein